MGTVVIAVSHDPKLDDLVLLEALKSPAFYIGALGSRGNTAKRRERLAMFDLTPTEIDRLRSTNDNTGAIEAALDLIIHQQPDYTVFAKSVRSA